MDDAWRILGIDQQCSFADAKKAYLLRLQLVHPDRHAGSSADIIEAAEEATRQAVDAWAVVEGQLRTQDPAPDQTAESVLSTVLPAYIGLDASHDALSKGFSFPEALAHLQSDDAAKSEAHGTVVSVGGMSSTVDWFIRDELLDNVQSIPTRPGVGSLHIEMLLAELMSVIDQGIERWRQLQLRVRRPLVFLLFASDVSTNANLSTHLAAFASPGRQRRPTLFTYGLTADSVDSVRTIGASADACWISDRGLRPQVALNRACEHVLDSIEKLSAALNSGTSGHEVALQAPSGFSVAR